MTIEDTTADNIYKLIQEEVRAMIKRKHDKRDQVKLLKKVDMVRLQFYHKHMRYYQVMDGFY